MVYSSFFMKHDLVKSYSRYVFTLLVCLLLHSSMYRLDSDRDVMLLKNNSNPYPCKEAMQCLNKIQIYGMVLVVVVLLTHKPRNLGVKVLHELGT